MKHTQSQERPKKRVRVPPIKDIARLEGKVSEPPERTTEEDLRFNQDIISPHDAAYESELQYNGYDDIEDYDNNAFDLNVEKEKQLDPERELNFDGRRAVPHEEDEENPVSPQDR